MRKRISRRTVLRMAGATAAGSPVVGSGVAAGDDTRRVGAGNGSREPIPPADVTVDDVELLSAVPEEAAGVRPGSAITSDNGGCTANFVWREVDEEKPDDELDLFLGTAGHCLLDEANACDRAAGPGEESEDVSDLTVAVDVEGTFGLATGRTTGVREMVELGEVVYARQNVPSGGSGVGHDFGLVRIPAALHDDVDPTLPQFGGPDGVSEHSLPEGDPVHGYGAGNGQGEAFPTMGRTGVALGDDIEEPAHAWQAMVRVAPGDSGSPLLGSDLDAGAPEGTVAAGIVTHALQVAPPAFGTDIGRCKEMPAEDGLDLAIEVVTADEG